MNGSKPNRRSIRLPGWNYRTAAFYFVTICTHRRANLFDDPRLHAIAAAAWAYIPQQKHAQHVALGEWVVMPNHVHGILQLKESPVAETADLPSADRLRPSPGSVGAIVGNYKMLVTKRVKAMSKALGSDMNVWQRGYWERIVRNEREFRATSEYIRQNPARWQEDRDNLDRLLARLTYVDER